MYALLILGLIISLAASWNVNATFRRYEKDSNSRGLTAAQVARQILDENGLYQIRVERISGKLTDHYDPSGNVIRLSDSVHDSTSVAAIGVAAHECGHAVQHEVGYFPMKIRSAVIPVTQIGSKFWYIIFLIGLVFGNSQAGQIMQMIGILLFSAIVFFQLITLPVEFNASNRAKALIAQSGGYTEEEQRGVSAVLSAAAMTYLASTFMALLQFLRLFLLTRNRD